MDCIQSGIFEEIIMYGYENMQKIERVMICLFSNLSHETHNERVNHQIH